MAKLIFGPIAAQCVSVEPASPAKALNWDQCRRIYEGLEGLLSIYESEQNSPGRPFLYFYVGDDSYLKTSYGEWHFEGEHLIFRTRNSRYVFRISKEERIRLVS